MLAQWLQLWILVFVITVFIFVAQWKGRLKVDPVEAQSKVVKETAWLFSYHSKHSLYILLPLQGPVTLRQGSQESLTSSQPHIVFSFVFSTSTEFLTIA